MATHVGGSRTVRLGACVVAIGALAVAGCSGGEVAETPTQPPVARTEPQQTPSMTAGEPSESENTAVPSSNDPPIFERDASADEWESVKLPERAETVPGSFPDEAVEVSNMLFASYYGGLVHGSTVNLEALSDTNCEFCKMSIAQIGYFDMRGMSLDPSFVWKIEETTVGGPTIDDPRHLVLARISNSNYIMRYPDGQVAYEDPPEILNMGLSLRKTQRGWVVSGVEGIEEGEYEAMKAYVSGDRQK